MPDFPQNTGASDGSIPERIDSEAVLDEVLTRPTQPLIEFISSVKSPLLVLGGSGKMGPTLARLAVRAAAQAPHPLEVVVVSRFTDSTARDWLEARGVRTLACDLMDPGAVAALPESPNLIYMVGLKFGTSRNPGATWAVNTQPPAHVVRRFRHSRIVVVSTGNVYPSGPVLNGGSREGDPLVPLGEYANAAVARERIFEFYATESGTPLAILRLFYAVELRYGVLVDLARLVFHDEPVPLANGSVSCIWQGDANEQVLRSLALASHPASVWNLSLSTRVSVREAALRFGTLLGREVRFEGVESTLR